MCMCVSSIGVRSTKCAYCVCTCKHVKDVHLCECIVMYSGGIIRHSIAVLFIFFKAVFFTESFTILFIASTVFGYCTENHHLYGNMIMGIVLATLKRCIPINAFGPF